MYKDDSADREEEKWSRKKKRYNNNEGRFYPINYSPKKNNEKKINKEKPGIIQTGGIFPVVQLIGCRCRSHQLLVDSDSKGEDARRGSR